MLVVIYETVDNSLEKVALLLIAISDLSIIMLELVNSHL